MSSPFQKQFSEKSPLNQTRVTGENTGKVKTDKSGKKYALREELSENGAVGDTIRIPNKNLIKNGYLLGGDYSVKKTGNKAFSIVTDPDAPGTPGTPGYEPAVIREDR